MKLSAGDRPVSIAATVQHALARAGVVYEVRGHTATESLEEAARTCGVSFRRFVRAVLLKDARGPLLVVLPLTYLIDFQALEGLLGRRPVPASADETVAAFPDCEPGTVPPLGAIYGIETLVDPSVYDSEDLCFEPGVHNMVVYIRRSGFRRLQAGARVAGCAQATSELQGGTAGGSGSELRVPEGLDLDSMVSFRRFVRAVLLKDARGPLLVVLPLTYLIDFQALEGLLGRRPVPASADETVAAFPDCEPGTVPPLGAIYGIETLVDPSVYDSEDRA